MDENGEVDRTVIEEIDDIYCWPEPDWWVVPESCSAERADQIERIALAIDVNRITEIESMTPRGITEAMLEILRGTQTVDLLAIEAAKRLTDVAGRYQQTQNYRKRLTQHEQMSEEARSRYNHRADRMAFAEYCVEYSRCERAGFVLPTLRDNEIALLGLCGVWRDLKALLAALGRRLKSADQIGKVMQKFLANHGSKSLMSTTEERLSSVEEMIRRAEEEDEIKRQSSSETNEKQ